MTPVDKLYDWLAQGPAPDCDRILAAALPGAGKGWSGRIVRILLSRGGEAAWAGLIGYYTNLDESTREQVLADDESFNAGVAIAFKSHNPDVRYNALLALEQRPTPKMAYLLASAVRDPVARVRGLGGQVLRKLADEFLTASEKDQEAGRPSPRSAARRKIVLAVEEALSAFDLHHRIEVVETALWFARDLGETLWEKMSSRRSRIGVVAGEQVYVWNSPRLAYFLVSSLKRAAWRQTAGRLLSSWRTAEQLRALFAHSALLDDHEIRKNLRAIHDPKWFRDLSSTLDELPLELQRCAPRWVCHAGYDNAAKTELLARWVDSDDADLHKEAVYALAEIDSPGARLLLRQVSESASPLAHFARWCAVALDTEVVREALKRKNPHERRHETPPVATPEEQDARADCTMLWQACRRTDPRKRGELIAALREHAELWRPQLRAYLHSPDPRDRVLVLQIVSTEQLALRFRHDLKPLLSDPLEGIRHLAQTLVSAISRRAVARDSDTPQPAPADDANVGEDREEARRALRSVLERLSSGETDPTDQSQLQQVRALLRTVYGEENEARTTAELVEDKT